MHAKLVATGNPKEIIAFEQKHTYKKKVVAIRLSHSMGIRKLLIMTTSFIRFSVSC